MTIVQEGEKSALLKRKDCICCRHMFAVISFEAVMFAPGMASIWGLAKLEFSEKPGAANNRGSTNNSGHA